MSEPTLTYGPPGQVPSRRDLAPEVALIRPSKRTVRESDTFDFAFARQAYRPNSRRALVGRADTVRQIHPHHPRRDRVYQPHRYRRSLHARVCIPLEPLSQVDSPFQVIPPPRGVQSASCARHCRNSRLTLRTLECQCLPDCLADAGIRSHQGGSQATHRPTTDPFPTLDRIQWNTKP